MTTVRRFLRDPLGMIGLVLLLTVLIPAVFAPYIAPYNPYDRVDVRIDGVLTPPDSKHILGLDDAGKDEFSQLLYGARVSLTVGFVAALVAMLIGTGVGLIAGYRGGRVGNALMRVVDVFLVIPHLPLMMVIMALWGRGLWKIVFVIGILGWTYTARLVRSQVLSIKERQFVLRAKSLGAGDLLIVMRHIFPQVLPLVVAQTVLSISGAILAESTLAFLGLGDPFLISWGTMISFAFQRSLGARAWWVLLPPGLAIVWVSMALVLIGNSLEGILNPRLRAHHLFNPRRMVSLAVGLPPRTEPKREAE
jgi:peptide/nickel transport system permease protein